MEEEIKKLEDRDEKMKKAVEIFGAHLMILNHPGLVGSIDRKVAGRSKII